MQRRNKAKEAEDAIQTETAASTSQPHVRRHHDVLIVVFWDIEELIVVVAVVISLYIKYIFGV